MVKVKEVIIEVSGRDEKIEKIIDRALERDFHLFLCDDPPDNLKGRRDITIYSPSGRGDILVVPQDRVGGLGRGSFAVRIELKDKGDELKAIETGKHGATAILVDTIDWKIIPLENLVAELHRKKTKIFAKIEDIQETETMLNILELGVDGVIFSPGMPEDIDKISNVLKSPRRVELLPAKVVEKREVGVGDRVCIDTASILKSDEGVLVGSQSGILFLIVGETLESKFSAARPFRVNAGPVHSYILLPENRTRYLSELECGDEVLILDRKGSPRIAIVGRLKIERRPLSLVKAECEGAIGKILVQNAETIRFMGKDGSPISVMELKLGDEIIVYTMRESGRHFGTEVDEFVIER